MSERGLTSAFVSALMQPGVRVFHLVEFAFASGTLRATTLDFQVSYGGADYLAGHGVMAVGELSEQPGSWDGWEVKLAGVTGSSLALALQERPQGRSCRLRLVALLTDNSFAVDDNCFVGTVDTLTWGSTPDPESGQSVDLITVACESLLATMDRPRPRRFDAAGQLALHPGDYSGEHVVDAEQAIVWPSAAFFRE